MLVNRIVGILRIGSRYANFQPVLTSKCVDFRGFEQGQKREYKNFGHNRKKESRMIGVVANIVLIYMISISVDWPYLRRRYFPPKVDAADMVTEEEEEEGETENPKIERRVRDTEEQQEQKKKKSKKQKIGFRDRKVELLN